MEYINPTKRQLTDYLRAVDKTFPVALSAQRDLEKLTDKIFGRGHCILAWDKGLAGGITWYDNDEETAYFNTLAVLPEFRRKGIARELMKRALEKLPDNIKAARIHTRTPGAYVLYTQFGFTPETPGMTMREIQLCGCYMRKNVR